MTDRPNLGTSLRAGRVLLSALWSPTGTDGSRRRALGLGLIGVVAAGGAAVAYAAADGKPAMPADRAAIELVVHDYILEHPEIIPEAIDRLKAKQVAAKIEEHRTELETPYKGAWEGAEKPRVTLVAFMDYACGYCRASLPDLARLVKDNPDLRIVYRELPIITNDSVGAAKVSLLAAESGRFMPFHRAMYEAGDVAPGAVIKAAERAGLDAGKAKAALRTPGADEQIVTNVRLAQALGAEGTPLFVLGDEMFTGAVGYDALKAAVDKVRNKG